MLRRAAARAVIAGRDSDKPSALIVLRMPRRLTGREVMSMVVIPAFLNPLQTPGTCFSGTGLTSNDSTKTRES